MTTMPRKAATSGRRAIRTRSEGDGARQADTGAQIPPYCTNCAHDLTNHRGGHCWVDALGEPLYRTRSLIACDCDGIQ